MTSQYVIVGCIVAAAAVWLGYSIYRSLAGKDNSACGLCSKCFGTDRCDTGRKQADGSREC